MKEFIEKLIGRLEEESYWTENTFDEDGYSNDDSAEVVGLYEAIEIVNQLAEEYNQEHDDTDYANIELYAFWQKHQWIPCSERLPEVETTVLIQAKRKYRDGGFRDIITTAMYEDGTMLENDSKWRWEDIEGEWDDENDCYIIPEGWWEDKKYNEDGELNHAVDDEVIAWQPLPAPYQPKGE